MGGWRLSGCELYVTIEPCQWSHYPIQEDRVIYGLWISRPVVPAAFIIFWLIHALIIGPMLLPDMEEECRQIMQIFKNKRLQY